MPGHRKPLSRPKLLVALVLGLTALRPAQTVAGDVGFETATVPYRGSSLEVGIWYPTTAAPAPHRLELFMQEVAADAPAAGRDHPLVVMSHGNGGSLGGHYDTALALALAGFVVAAPTHAGDNYRDHSRELQMQDRPPQISATIDFVLRAWRGHASVDPHRIGMFGFSAGGFTTLISIGGRPDFTLIEPYCARNPHTFVCVLRQQHAQVNTPVMQASDWARDPRIRAAVIAAPALGFTFTHAGLGGVTVPVQLWAAADDHVLPVPDNAGAVAAALPHPADYHLVAGADHFDFLAPCSVALAHAVAVLCTEHAGFDRTAFHRQFDDAVVRFFTQTLAP